MGLLENLLYKGVDILLSDKTVKLARIATPIYRSYLITNAEKQEKNCYTCVHAVRLKFLEPQQKWCLECGCEVDVFGSVCNKYKKAA